MEKQEKIFRYTNELDKSSIHSSLVFPEPILSAKNFKVCKYCMRKFYRKSNNQILCGSKKCRNANEREHFHNPKTKLKRKEKWNLIKNDFKICKYCGNKFYRKDFKKPFNKMITCGSKECKKLHHKEYWNSNKNEFNKKRKEYRKEHKEDILKKAKEYYWKVKKPKLLKNKKIIKKNCLFCKTEFIPTNRHSYQKYCSKNCHRNHRNLLKKNQTTKKKCIYCNEKFKTYIKSQKFCKRKCQHNYWKQHHQLKTLKKLKEKGKSLNDFKYCIFCNKKLFRRDYIWIFDRLKTCSNIECKKKYKKEIDKLYYKKYSKIYRKQQKQKEIKRREKIGLPPVESRVFIKELEMFVYVSKLFPKEVIIRNDRKVLDGLELDIYLPSLKLAFEYQGEQHFFTNTFFIQTKEGLEIQKWRDRRKKQLCEQKGIILIEIKYNEELSEQLILSKLKEKNIECNQEEL